MMPFLLQTCRIYIPFPFQWGPPTFRAGEAIAMVVATFIASTEVSCILFFIFLIAQKKFSLYLQCIYCDEIPPPPPKKKKSLLNRYYSILVLMCLYVFFPPF